MKSSLSQSLSLSPFHFGFRGEQVNFSSVMRPCTRRTKNIKSAATIFLNHHQSSSSKSSTLFCNYPHYFAKSRVFGVASSSSSSFSGLDSQLRQMRLSLLYQSHRAQKGKLSRSSTGRKSTLAATYASSSSSENERSIQVHPHVLSAYAFDVNPNFELTVSTVAGRAETKTKTNFPSEEEVKEIAEIWDTTRTNREKMTPAVSPFMRTSAASNDVGDAVELFARTRGEIVRYGDRGRKGGGKQPLGERRIDTTGLISRDDNSAVGEEGNDEDTELCVELMREGLYMHCNAHKAIRDSYTVSRGKDKSSIVLTARSAKEDVTKERGGGKTDEEEDNLLLDQFTVTINAHSFPPRLEVRLGKERRSALTVRQILDDPALRESLKDGDEVVALGGPKVSGKIDLSSNSFGFVGEPRKELNGESLLDYHRSRYKDRIPMLANAKDDDEAVGLKLPGQKSAWAYPAELLSLKSESLGASSPSSLSVELPDPETYQKKVSKIRQLLGDDAFAPLARINPKMMRLSNGETASVYSCSASREGGLSTGPSKAFSDFETSYYDLAFVSSDGNEEDAREAIKQLASEIESVLKTKWTHFSEEQVAFLVNDVKSMRVVSTPPPKEEKRKKGRKPIAYVQSIVAADGDFKTKRYSRWAADKERERFALFLNANRGGTSVTNQRALMDDVDDYGLSETYFVGCSVDYSHQYGEGSSSSSSSSFSPPGYPLIDSTGAIVARNVHVQEDERNHKQPITSAVAFALEHMRTKKTKKTDENNPEDFYETDKTKELTVHALSSYTNSKASPTDVESAFALAETDRKVKLKILEIKTGYNNLKAFSWDPDLKKTAQAQYGFHCVDAASENESVCVTTHPKEDGGGVVAPLFVSSLKTSSSSASSRIRTTDLKHIVALSTCNQFGIGETRLPVTLSADVNSDIIVLV